MDRLYQLTVSTPANTAIIAPQSTTWRLEDAKLISVTIIVPDGHAGLTGIRLLQAGQEIAPYSNNDWFVSNNEKIDISINEEMTATGLVVQTYNTDFFPHKFWLRALIQDLTASGAAVGAALTATPADILSGPLGI